MHEGLGQLLAEGLPTLFEWLVDMLLDPKARFRRIGCLGLMLLAGVVAAAIYWLR